MKRHLACVVGEEHGEQRSPALVVEMVEEIETRGWWKCVVGAASAAAGKESHKINLQEHKVKFIYMAPYNITSA